MAAPSIESILSEANRLVDLGLYQAACNILDEYLSHDGGNKHVLRGLARVRLLQGRPSDAVPLLLRALGRAPREHLAGSSAASPKVAHTAPKSGGDSSISHADHEFIEQTASDIQAQRDDQGYTPALAEDLADDVPSYAPQKRGESSKASAVLTPTGENFLELSPIRGLSSTPTSLTDDDTLAQADALQEQFEARPEVSKALEQISADVTAGTDLAEESVLQNEAQADPHDADLPEKFDWEALEPEGADYDEAPTREELEWAEVQAITRAQRARQVAVALATTYGWDEKGLAVLTGVFERYWWGAAKRSVERELERGLTESELKLAVEIREIWADHVEFSGNFAYNGYLIRYLSWPAALELVRSFRSMPDTAEVEHLLLVLYERWYGSRHLIDRFHPLCSTSGTGAGQWSAGRL